jgi:hypothetical protein
MADDEASGFKRPPNNGRFKPGVSGNPRGRPKGSHNQRTDLTQLMEKKIPVRENGKALRIRTQQAVLRRLCEQALRGDVKAINSIISTMLKLDPTAGSANQVSEAISEADDEIIADFRRRNQKEE